MRRRPRAPAASTSSLQDVAVVDQNLGNVGLKSALPASAERSCMT